MRHRILLGASICFLIAANIIWVRIDNRPPFWDMANHAGWSLGVLRDFQHNGLSALLTLPSDSGSYPPLYYAVVAVFYRLLGTTIDSAQLANLPAIVLLGLGTYGIAHSLMEPGAAAMAAAIANFIPFMLWLSRETMLEYWLTAMIAVSLWALLKTKDFSDSKWSIVFGLCCGLGMLTKWTFVIFVGLPALWAARRNLRNALKAAAVAAILASYWYVPQMATMPKFWNQVAVASRNELDSSAFSLDGLVFYVRALEGSLLFLPLFIAFVVGLGLIFIRFRVSFPRWTPVVLGLAGSWIGVLLLPNQDPRYAVGVLPLVSVVAATPFQKKPAAQLALSGFLLFQHVLVSFGMPQLPERIVLREGQGGELSYDWTLYQQNYFRLWGPPQREDWHIDRVLQRVSEGSNAPVRLGLVPDLPRLDVPAYQFAIDLHGYPVTVARQFSPDESSLLENDYLLIVDGKQTAFGSVAPKAAEINAFVAGHADKFKAIDEFFLPSGEKVLLYRCVG